MKILMDPMVKLRADAVLKINLKFAERGVAALHKEGVYARKRALATAILSGEKLPEDHPFVIEAGLRGLPQDEFARDILAKPDVAGAADARELLRQDRLLKIKSASTPAVIEEILATL